MPPLTLPSNVYTPIFGERFIDRFNPTVDWKEDLDTVSPSDAHFSNDGANSAVLHGIIPFRKLRSFILFACGHAWAEKVAPWRLFRFNPPTHPLFPFLRVRGVTVKGFKPRRDPDATLPASPPPPSPPPSPLPPPWFPYPANTSQPNTQDLTPVETFVEDGQTYTHPQPTMSARIHSMRPRMSGENFGGGAALTDDRAYYPFNYLTTRYEEARVAVEFSQPAWNMVEDGDAAYFTGDESTRNVFWTTEPSLDVLAIEGGKGNGLFWRETAAGGPAVATNIPAAASTAVLPQLSGFLSPTGFLDAKILFSCNWMGVPERYVFNASLIPTKILTVLGKINASDWSGFRAKTLLLMAVSFQPVNAPVYGINNPVVRLWNVRFSFKHYDPERPEELDPPVTVTPAPGSDPDRGWTCFRHNSGYVFRATRHNGKDLYAAAEYSKLFEHIEAP